MLNIFFVLTAKILCCKNHRFLAVYFGLKYAGFKSYWVFKSKILLHLSDSFYRTQALHSIFLSLLCSVMLAQRGMSRKISVMTLGYNVLFGSTCYAGVLCYKPVHASITRLCIFRILRSGCSWRNIARLRSLYINLLPACENVWYFKRILT